MGRKNNLIFQLTVAHANASEREKEYKIFDGEPSFFNLSKKERKAFINHELTKVKEFLEREYRKSNELKSHRV